MEQNKNSNAVRSGIDWISAVLGFGSLIFAILATIGRSKIQEIWGLWLFAVLGIWLLKTDEFWLNSNHYIERDMFWMKRVHDLGELKWIDFRFKNLIFLWIGDEKKEIKISGRRGNKTKALIDLIGAERLPYYGYKMSERSKLSRGQLSGCLDCHQIFPPTELKTWERLPKSFWMGRKKDQYLSRCPSCKGGWLYTHPNLDTPVTLQGLQIMDKNFELDKETKMRDIIGETLAFQTSFNYFK